MGIFLAYAYSVFQSLEYAWHVPAVYGHMPVRLVQLLVHFDLEANIKHMPGICHLDVVRVC